MQVGLLYSITRILHLNHVQIRQPYRYIGM